MKLLGLYNSTLQSFQYQELLLLYQQQITQGGFAGNVTFDATAINNLITQSQNFASLPLPAEGQIAIDDVFNYPLSILTARYNALQSETTAFNAQIDDLIAVLGKDTLLLDILISGANLNAWVAQQPILSAAQQFSWDYGMGAGPTSPEISQTDPANDVLYPTNCPTNTYIDAADGTKYTGLVAPSIDITDAVKNLTWTWTQMSPGEQAGPIYGSDWAGLDLLEDYPIINFLPNPSVQLILPLGSTINGIFSFSGQTSGSGVPIYVNTLFVPRRNTLVLSPTNAISNPSFAAGSIDWTLGDGWSIQTGSNAYKGSKYASKVAFETWDTDTSYTIGDDVTYLGIDYRSKTSNLGSAPNIPGNTDWAITGILQSSEFPLGALDTVYVEGWLQNLATNGVMNIVLICLDTNGNQVGPPISLPGISSAEDWLMVSGSLQAVNIPTVVSGIIQISIYGQTEGSLDGSWSLGLLRVHLPQNLSTYSVNQNDAVVYLVQSDGTPSTVYFSQQDFVVDEISNIIFMDLPDGVPVTVRFTENFPGYQCSVNELVWSPVIMLDPARLYPDNTTQFYPIQLGVNLEDQRTLFPLTDETGIPSGLFMELIGVPQYEYYFQVATTASPQYGTTAVLEIDLTSINYMNGLQISPFSSFPLRLVQVDIQSFGSDTKQTIGLPNALIDRPVVLTFPTSSVRSVFLTLYQESYIFDEYVVQPPDAVARNVLATLQSVLPTTFQAPTKATPVYVRGAVYEFGLENIIGINSSPILPGIFVAGPHHFIGCPEVFRFDASFVDTSSIDDFNAYLCWIAYDSSDNILNTETTGIQISSGQCSVWPFPSPSILDRSTVDHVDISLKFVLRGSEVVLQRYLLQVTSA